jgi:pimeloyl-ACP methyl ester carboxylesterase
MEVQGLTIRFRRAGHGPALVLVHGLLGYSFSWRLAVPMLAQEREVFALDMPGAGFSDCSLGLDCGLISAAHRLLGFMDEAGIVSCDLVGSSYGGTTAMMAAALARSRIRKLVLVSPANPWSKIGRKRLALLRNPVVATLLPILALPMRPLHRLFVRRMYGDPRRITEETLRGYARPLRRPGVLEHAVRTAAAWQADMRELEAALPKISDVPTLLVWGSKDRVVDPASAELLRCKFRKAQICIMEGSGHLPYEECPDEFSRIVTEFLADTSGSLSRQAETSTPTVTRGK